MLLLFSFILVPFIFGVLSFFSGSNAKRIALTGSCISLVLSLCLITQFCEHPGQELQHSVSWIPAIGASLSLSAGAAAAILVLLTAIIFPLIFIAQWKRPIENPSRFYGLMLLSQAGLMGVFLAHDLLLFYFFWELALIPVYFLCSLWGGEKRIRVTFKFFIYTFLGSLIMLAAIIWLYIQTPTRSFDYATILQTGQSLSFGMQQIFFWMLFIAFAIKMPLFPFHTWQPDTYEQSATPVTIVLSAIMVKMGLFAAYKWLLPVLPEGAAYWSQTVMILSVTGIIYASLLAMVQSDLKRIVAYSSIAHVGLMSLGLFADTPVATNGFIFQMFNHGINITGMWLIVSMIEDRYKTRDLKALGGMSGAAPAIAISLVIMAFASIGLPLTNGFIGEFMLFLGVFQSANPNHIAFMVIAGLGIILGAIYTLNMVQKVAYGTAKTTLQIEKIRPGELFCLVIIIVIIIVLGVYPKLLLGLIG